MYVVIYIVGRNMELMQHYTLILKISIKELLQYYIYIIL